MNTIRLRGPADILAALPYQLGYHPHDAVVVVTLTDRSIGLVQRVDLPPADHAVEAVAALLPALARERPDAALLVGYESEAGSALPVLDALEDSCTDLGIEVIDRLVVRDGRWFAPDCDGGCCPDAGTALPAPEDTPAVAEFVALEIAPLRDRSSLADQLRPDRDRCREVERALADADGNGPGSSGSPPPRDAAAAVGGRLRVVPSDGPAGPNGALGFGGDGDDGDGGDDAGDGGHGDDHAQTVRRLRWLATWAVVGDVSAARPPVEGLAPEEVAGLARSLRDIELRDGVIAWLCPGTLPLDALGEDLVDLLRSSLPEPAWADAPSTSGTVVAGRRLQARLVQLCRALPDTEAAPMLTVLANVTWWLGDGALARTALERALEVEPDYRLARLLDRLVGLAIRPRVTA